jgi:murein DD-endopeptidase MepM/ murein hydrolase activator NlpD
MRKLIAVMVFAVAALVTWFMAGRGSGPAIMIVWPTSAIGQNGELLLTLQSPESRLTELNVELVQADKRFPVFALRGPDDTRVVHEGDTATIRAPIGRQHAPELQEGGAVLSVTAARPTLFGLQQVKSEVALDLAVKLAPPRVSVLSQFHYINHGGSELVLYRVTPATKASGVRVGELEYPGYPASGAGVETADSTLRVAFFGFMWDQPANTAIHVYARDDARNEGTATFDFRVFPKVFRKSRIELSDAFLGRVVPAILQNTPELTVENPADLLASYLRINRDLRRDNNAYIASLVRQTSSAKLWDGPFRQLTNTAVEAGFADQRTYIYQDGEVDQQTHLGFDLASTAAAPVLAANGGVVVSAGWLGIYGNCVIIDHGMGLQSLYAHLSSIAVAAGDTVSMGAELGRSGATGLAGGDHLHFTMLLGGNAVNPIDWWSAQWVEDRITRKLREAPR